MAKQAASIDEKVPLHEQSHNRDYDEEADRKPLWKRNLLTRVIPAILTLLAMFALFRSVFVCNHHYAPGGRQSTNSELVEELERPKIELEAHGMSRCPDFRDCLRDLVVPTMIQVSDKVNFTLSFIGR